MSHPTRFFAVAAGVLAAVALSAAPASANSQDKSVIHVNDTSVDSGVCSFDVTFHSLGQFKNVDYYDNSGFLYKTIDTPGGGGPFTVTASAHGTTLTMQSEAFSFVTTYNPDGSPASFTQRGPFDKFTKPGSGIVLLDTGVVKFDSEFNVVLMGGPHQAVIGEFDAFCAAFG
jgi:hypothetical protein